MKLSELLEKNNYPTDKDAYKLNCYEPFFEKFRNRPINLLELGVFQGGSMMLWQDYFHSDSNIVGIDNQPKQYERELKVYDCAQDDADKVRAVCNDFGDLIHIIIDDCSHVAEPTERSMQILFPYLVSGGFYVIEDWGTGYWPSWFDGAPYIYSPHYNGMAKVIHDLVDECAAADYTATMPNRGVVKPARQSTIKQLHIGYGWAIVEKA